MEGVGKNGGKAEKGAPKSRRNKSRPIQIFLRTFSKKNYVVSKKKLNSEETKLVYSLNINDLFK